MPEKRSYDYVKSFIESKGCQLVSTEYNGNLKPLQIIMQCGHEMKITFNKFSCVIKDYDCSVCNKILINKKKIVIAGHNFINNAKIKHDNKYDYSNVIYKDCETKVIITCPKHGDFEQTPTQHLRGCGCSPCAYELNGLKYAKTFDYFVQQAIEMHDNKYNYDESSFKNMTTKTIITCIKHGKFEQMPSSHVQGYGCAKCTFEQVSINNSYTTEIFINKAKEIHGDKYDYSKVNYVKSNQKVIIICKIHGEFNQYANAHLQEHGCPYCGNVVKLTTEQFIEESKKIHDDTYEYDDVVYDGIFNNVIIKCKIHGKFEQIAKSHLEGRGCILCGYVKSGMATRKSQQQFIDEAIKLYGDKYDYTNTDYITCDSEITIKCKIHGDYTTTPYYHLRGRECIKCKPSNYSKKSIRWLEYVEKKENIHIQHALNGGEYRIGRYKVDGYCKETNTCFEFFGDYFHGNPKVFKPLDYNKLLKKQFAELLINTNQRIIDIQNKGYIIEFIWESDWDIIEKQLKV